MRYACIERCRNRYPVRLMCRLLGVSASGYYAWRQRPESARAQRNRELMPKIRRIHQASKGVYGSPRVHAELLAEGISVGRHKVAQLMRSERLRGCPKRRYPATTQRDPSHPVARNLLKRDFSADVPNRRWASDITYIPTRQGWLFLVMDPYSRRIVYLRTLFVQATHIILMRPQNWSNYSFGSWLEEASKRMHKNKLAVALANKLARIAWSILRKSKTFDAHRIEVSII